MSLLVTQLTARKGFPDGSAGRGTQAGSGALDEQRSPSVGAPRWPNVARQSG